MYTENFAAVMSTAMKSSSEHAPETVDDLQQLWQYSDTAGTINASLLKQDRWFMSHSRLPALKQPSERFR